MKILMTAMLAATLLSQAALAYAKQMIVGFKAEVSASDRSAALKRMGLKFVEALPEIDAVVAETSDFRMAMADLSLAASAESAVTGMEENEVRNWLQGDMVAFQAVPLPAFGEVMASLPKMAKAKAAELPPLPPGVSKEEIPWGIQRVNAPNAWAKTKGEGVKVAVIDTGIDFNHPDLKSNYAGCYNAINSKASCMDDNGHGSHVSGTIAGALDGKGVAGVAPKARLYAVKVLDGDGSGGLVGIIKGIVWAGNNGIQVANMSLGAPIGTIFMRAAVKYATLRGTTIVAAAGNNGGRVGCPACYGDAIAVSASDSSDRIASFSSRGSDVDFIAPGVDVKSSVPGGGYDWYDGTSMASPHVAGLAALAVARGAKGPAGVRAALKGAAKSIGLKPQEQGAGLVDAATLVK
ncbi:MAG: S8 family serine peptidase [Elusimicrobia bacterium]|nr:S8 family serine peptidase [Elusimicrobiota bacterium]